MGVEAAAEEAGYTPPVHVPAHRKHRLSATEGGTGHGQQDGLEGAGWAEGARVPWLLARARSRCPGNLLPARIILRAACLMGCMHCTADGKVAGSS